MANLTTSADIDTFMQSANFAAARAALGVVASNPVIAHVAYNTSVSHASSAEVCLPLSAIDYDPASAWSIHASGGLVVPASGAYLFQFTFWGVDGDGDGGLAYAGVAEASTETAQKFAMTFPGLSSNNPRKACNGSVILQCTASDQIQLKFGSFDDAAGRTIVSYWRNHYCYLTAHRIY